MFTPYHASGFYFTPVSKCVLGTLVLSSLAFNIPLNAYRNWLSYSVEAISYTNLHQCIRFLACRSIFLDPKDLICSMMLLYHFRLFERRYGSRKFASHLLGTWTLAALLELLAVFICRRLELPLDSLPAGPFGLVYAFFVPYFCDIPRVAVTHILHIPVTGKSLTYIIGLQMASSSAESLLLAICGIVAGLIYHHNILWIQSVFSIPRIVGYLFGSTVGWLVDTGPPPQQIEPMGATLEIQRQQQIQHLEQQMALAQLNRPQIGNLGFGIFGNRYNFANRPMPPTEEQVQQLIDMGFTRERVLHALQITNNDVTNATNVLLHQS